MKSHNRSNALLVELLIVIMFFMLAATSLLQVFVAAERQSDQSGMMIDALNDAQDVIDRLYAADAPEASLAEMGFSYSESDQAWVRPATDAAAASRVVLNADEQPAGRLTYFSVSVLDRDSQPLVSLRNARYQEATP